MNDWGELETLKKKTNWSRPRKKALLERIRCIYIYIYFYILDYSPERCGQIYSINFMI